MISPVEEAGCLHGEKNGCTMKKLLLVVGMVSLLLGFSFLAPAVIIDPSMQFIVGNETYKVNATMVFDQIIISSSYIVFNETGFYVYSPNSITITLVYINDDVIGAANGEKIVDFYATTTAGTVWCNLSGFPVGNEYVIKRNGVTVSTSVANASGFISFSNAAWSTQRFQIFQQAQASGDSTPPQISGVTRTTSNPLDTDPLYGWVNVSCTVTDNVAVSQVILRIHTPGGSWNNVSMVTRTTGKYYYRSTTAFSSAGNYSYSIWAKDTSNNAVTSSTVLFSMPPRWDMNSDGVVTILDLVLISNHYSEIGASGWIREDVDNNGRVQILDMSLVSVHFGEEWWS
ncbi:MAG: hypothetical protein IMZ43_06090 [Thermoplasmata archaeon]|nr:hypothetical protein [Thermoplasmata archaeon]